MKKLLQEILEREFEETQFDVIKVCKGMYHIVWTNGHLVSDVERVVKANIPPKKQSGVYFLRCLSQEVITKLLTEHKERFNSAYDVYLVRETTRQIVAEYAKGQTE